MTVFGVKRGLDFAKLNLLKDEGSHIIESDGLYLKRGFMYLKKEAMLVFSLRLMQLSSHCTPWLKEMNPIFMTFKYRWYALMLMSPDHKVEKLRYHALSKTVSS